MRPVKGRGAVCRDGQGLSGPKRTRAPPLIGLDFHLRVRLGPYVVVHASELQVRVARFWSSVSILVGRGIY